jgi:hypothetical protein
MERYARKCDITGKGMNEGWCWGDGAFYTSTLEATLKELRKDQPDTDNLSDDELLTWAADADILYWTTWYDEEYCEGDTYYDAEGNEYEVPESLDYIIKQGTININGTIVHYKVHQADGETEFAREFASDNMINDYLELQLEDGMNHWRSEETFLNSDGIPDVHREVEWFVPYVDVSKFIEWFLSEGDDKMSLGNKVSDALLTTGICTITWKDLISICGYIPDHLVSGEVIFEDEYETGEINWIDDITF